MRTLTKKVEHSGEFDTSPVLVVEDKMGLVPERHWSVNFEPFHQCGCAAFSRAQLTTQVPVLLGV
jgi:hypothetical protein